jgi:hypothetical protein
MPMHYMAGLILASTRGKGEVQQPCRYVVQGQVYEMERLRPWLDDVGSLEWRKIILGRRDGIKINAKDDHVAGCSL